MRARNVERIGKYQVRSVIGRGSMGTVYEALAPIFQRRVALKTVSSRESDRPELKARFVREAQAAGRLKHRNIVTVYDVGEDNGQPYIAMELVEGFDLERVIQEKWPLAVDGRRARGRRPQKRLPISPPRWSGRARSASCRRPSSSAGACATWTRHGEAAWRARSRLPSATRRWSRSRPWPLPTRRTASWTWP